MIGADADRQLLALELLPKQPPQPNASTDRSTEHLYILCTLRCAFTKKCLSKVSINFLLFFHRSMAYTSRTILAVPVKITMNSRRRETCHGFRPEYSAGRQERYANGQATVPTDEANSNIDSLSRSRKRRGCPIPQNR